MTKVAASVFTEDMEILPGANIVELGTKNGTVSDADGRFELNVASPQSDLTISYVGYKTVIVSAADIGSYIELPQDAEALEEVNVTGHTKPKKDNSLLWLGALIVGAIAGAVIFRPKTVKV